MFRDVLFRKNIYIYVCACSFVIIEKSCLYRAYFHFFHSCKERRGEQGSSIFFFHHWNPAVVEIRLFKYISFLFSFGSCYYSYVKYRLINRLADNLGHVSYETTTSGPIFATCVLFLPNESHISLYDNRFIKTASCSF